MNNKEVWKDIIGYEGLYKVSDFGKIFSVKRNKVLKQKINKGYYTINLSKEGKLKTYSVHRIVAQIFIENKENKKEVNHIDENKLNNKLENLSWVTAKENSNWGTRNQRIKICNTYGEAKDARKPKFKVNKICMITRQVLKTYSSLKEAIEHTGIHQPNISSCINGKKKSAGGYIWEKVS